MSGTDRRREILKAIEQAVCTDRQNTYGDAEDNFDDIARIANIVFEGKMGMPWNRLDVALFCCCIKLARCGTSPRHLDNLVDLAGYAVCGAGIVEADSEELDLLAEIEETWKQIEFEPPTAEVRVATWSTGTDRITVSEDDYACQDVPEDASPCQCVSPGDDNQLELPFMSELPMPFIIDGQKYENRVVYIHGPFSNGGKASDVERAANTEEAIRVGIALSEKGWLPHIPHAATQPLDGLDWMTYEDFMELDRCLLGACSAGFRFGGDSPGADRESQAFRDLGRPVWTRLSDVPDLVPTGAAAAGL
jgi:hypothetical protein